MKYLKRPRVIGVKKNKLLLLTIFLVFFYACKSTEAIQQQNALAVEVLTLLKPLDKINDDRIIITKNYLHHIYTLANHNFPIALKELQKLENTIPEHRQNARRKAKLYLKKNKRVTVFLTDLFTRINADKAILKNSVYNDTYNALENSKNQINAIIKKYNVISETSNGYYPKYESPNLTP